MVSTSRVRKHRELLREQGYHLVQIWVKDTSSPAFIEEARRQSALCAANPDPELDALMDRINRDMVDELDAREKG